MRRLVVAIVTALAALTPVARAATPTLAVLAEIAGPDGPWDYASVDAATRRLYLGRGDGVLSLDLASQRLTPIFVSGHRVHAVTPLGDTGLVLATNGETNTATMFASSDGRVIVEIPTGRKPDAAIWDPASRLAFVMNGESGDVTIIDPATASAVGAIPVGGKLEFSGVDGRGKLYVNVEDRAELAMIDTRTRAIVARHPLPGCERPTGLAVDAAHDRVFVACGNGVALALGAADGAVQATLPIGRGADAVILDAARGLAYVPCGEGSLAVISADAATPALLADVKTVRGARTGALDPVTGRLYLPAADLLPAEAGQRSKPKPGTFRLVVVGSP